MTAAIDLNGNSGEAAPSARIAGFSGFVHGVSLVDLLQIFHYARRALTLTIEPDASIHMLEGEVIHARVGELTGDVAITNILRRASGTIRTSEAETVPTSIVRPFHFLILDALRELDEIGRDEPEESQTFSVDGNRNSRFPSIPAAGNELLRTACAQLLGRFEDPRCAAIYDLQERRVAAHAGTMSMEALGRLCSSQFFRPHTALLDAALGVPSIDESLAHEVRVIGRDGVFLAKKLRDRDMGVVLVLGGGEAPGIAWAELRQSTQMLERILP